MGRVWWDGCEGIVWRVGCRGRGCSVHVMRRADLYCIRPVAIAAGTASRAKEGVFEKVEGLAAATVEGCCQSSFCVWVEVELTPPRCELQRPLREHVGRHLERSERECVDEDATELLVIDRCFRMPRTGSRAGQPITGDSNVNFTSFCLDFDRPLFNALTFQRRPDLVSMQFLTHSSVSRASKPESCHHKTSSLYVSRLEL